MSLKTLAIKKYPPAKAFGETLCRRNTTPEHTAPSAHHVQCHVKVTEAAQAFYSEI